MRRPQDGQKRERFLHSSALLWIPDATIRKPIAVVITSSARTCESRVIVRRLFPRGRGGNTGAARMRMSLEVEVAAAAVGNVRVQLGRGQIGVAEHLLDAAQIGPALEQVSREGVPQEVRVDALRLEPGLGRELRRIRKAPARVSGPPWALRKSSGR